MNKIIEKYKILILEDNKSDAELIQRELIKTGKTITFKTIESREDFERDLEDFKPDLILSDYELPSYDGLTAFYHKQKKSPDTPFILISGVISKENADELLKNGVTDYIWKNDLSVLIPKVNRALKESHEIKEKKFAEEKLKFLTNEFILLTTALSHDLRAPVRVMDGYLEMLWDDHCKDLNQEGVRVYNLVKQNNKHLKSLMDYLLEFSRLAIRELKITHIDVKELLEEIIEDTNQKVEHNAKIVVRDIHPIIADPTLIHIMFMHLLSNAIKFSDKNPEALVEIYSEEKRDQIIYVVKDNGIGFDMQYVHKLFGTFQKLHEPGLYEGTGMGLAIVQRIVNKHYGKVWAESKVGEGATLFCSFPKEMA